VYKHILIATDGSEIATKALEHGLALAKRDNARVTVITVTEPWSAFDIAHETRQGRPSSRGDHRYGQGSRMRSNCHGITWPTRRNEALAR
jgi:hypothetical protein